MLRVLLCLFFSSALAVPLKQDIVEIAPAVDPQNLVSYGYALDFSVLVNVNAFKCFKSNGYGVAFIRGYSPAGQGAFDTNSYLSINNAYSAGVGTEVYMTPQPVSSKAAYVQFDEMYNGLKSRQITVTQVWIQVTSPVNWNRNATTNINFIANIINRAKSYNLGVAIYTNQYDWSQITNNWNGAGSSVGLWYWNVAGAGVGGETAPNFNDFRSFGSWSSPSVKQFAQAESVCNTTVNRDVYSAGAKKMEGMAHLEKSEGIVVGGFVQI